MTEPDLAQLRHRIAKRTGLSHSLLERSAVTGFVERRSSQLQLSHETAYYELALQDPDELELLVQEVSVAETWFFRYPASLQLLVDRALELRRRQADTIRMLSIACATGEEPYSMVLAAVAAGWPLDRIRVDAIDRCEASLAMARKAVYGGNSFRVPTPAWAEKWIQLADQQVQMDDDVVAAVKFHQHDILTGPLSNGPKTYDVVFCRNLLIYLSAAARSRLVDVLNAVVAPDGFLCVGHAEYALLPPELFASTGAKQAFALQRVQSATVRSRPSVAFRSNSAATAQLQTPTPPVVSAPPPVSAGTAVSSAPRGDEAQQTTLAEAHALANKGQLDEAITALERLGTLPSAEVFELLGSIQLRLGRLKAARDAFHRVLYLEPDHSTVLLQLVYLCEQLGDAEQAARYRRRATRVCDD